MIKYQFRYALMPNKKIKVRSLICMAHYTSFKWPLTPFLNFAIL